MRYAMRSSRRHLYAIVLVIAMVGAMVVSAGRTFADSTTVHLASSASVWVRNIDWASFDEPAPADENADRARRILLNSNKYALTTWWDIKYGDQDPSQPYLDFNGISEVQIRRPAAEAFALATSLRTGAYDEAVTGVPAAQAIQKAVRLTASLAYRHQANSAGGWGNEWQSALWVYYAGHAAWLLWDDLTGADQEMVARMLESEADRFLGYAVPYYQDRAGTVRYPGDSKAEENAWNANLLQLVTAMMPDHPHQAQWMSEGLELMVSAFARPSDLESDEILSGRKVKDWLNGSNILPDGTLYNHGFIHPDYMATVAMNTAAPLTYGLARVATPKAAIFNADLVYSALTTVDFASPPYDAPGGTIYTTDAQGLPTELIYYPSGNDWGTHRRMQFAALDAQAHLFGYDSASGIPAEEWERVHSDKVLEMQARGTDGRTYQTPSEDTYTGREEWVAYAAAQQYLSHWLVAQHAVRFKNQAYRWLDVATTVPDQIVAGTEGFIDITVRTSTPVPARNVQLSVEAPSGWTITAQNPMSWPLIKEDSQSVRLTIAVPESQLPGRFPVALRFAYQQAPGDDQREHVEQLVIRAVPKDLIASSQLTATASDYQPGNEPSKAIDMNDNTIWHSSYRPVYVSLPHTITLRLRTAHNVGGLYYQPRLDHPNGIITKYKVYASADGQAFTEVAAGDWALDATVKIARFDAPGARFIRLEALEGGGNYASAAEIALTGKPSFVHPDLIPVDQMTATASDFQPGNEPSKAIDLNDGTIWHSSYRPVYVPMPHAITLELTEAYDVRELHYQPRLDHPNGVITKYRVYASADGQSFTEVAAGDWALDATAKVAQFSAPAARVIRFEAIEAGGNYASAAEIALIGVKTAS